jgi:hypothetical protein
MIDPEIDRDEVEAQALIEEVADEALEAALGTRGAGATTLLNAGSYCFTCGRVAF